MDKDTPLITLKMYVLICFFFALCLFLKMFEASNSASLASLVVFMKTWTWTSNYLSSLRPPCPLHISLITCDNFKCLNIYLHVVSMKIPSDLNCWSSLGLTMRGKHANISVCMWLFYCSSVCCNTPQWQIYLAFCGILWKSGVIFVWKKLWFNLTFSGFLDSLSYPLF